MLANRVREYTETSGTGDITLAGAMPGHVRFADGFSVGDSVLYVLEDGANYEIGTGTFAANNTLKRTNVQETLVAGVLKKGVQAVAIALSGQARVYSAVTSEFLTKRPEITTDIIREITPDAGVIVDDVKLKDGGAVLKGTSAKLEFAKTDNSIKAAVEAQAADVHIQNLVNSGKVVIEGKNSGGTTTPLVDADPDGAVNIYHDGVKKVSSAAGGLSVDGVVEASGGLKTENVGTLGTAGSDKTRNALTLLSDGSRVLFGTQDRKPNWKIGGQDEVDLGFNISVGTTNDSDPTNDSFTNVVIIKKDNLSVLETRNITGVAQQQSQVVIPDVNGNRGGFGVLNVTGGSLGGIAAQQIAGGTHPNSVGRLDVWVQNGAGTATPVSFHANGKTSFHNDAIFSDAIISANLDGIHRNVATSSLNLAGGTSQSSGGFISLRGPSHPTEASDIIFGVNGGEKLRWNNDANNWNFNALNQTGVTGVSRGVATGDLRLSGGSGNDLGANIIAYGQSHPSDENDMLFRAGTTPWMHYDHSAQTVKLSRSITGTFARFDHKGSAAVPVIGIDYDGTGKIGGIFGNSDNGSEFIGISVAQVERLRVTSDSLQFKETRNITGVAQQQSQVVIPDVNGNRGGFGVLNATGGSLGGIAAQQIAGGTYPNSVGRLDVWVQNGAATTTPATFHANGDSTFNHNVKISGAMVSQGRLTAFDNIADFQIAVANSGLESYFFRNVDTSGDFAIHRNTVGDILTYSASQNNWSFNTPVRFAGDVIVQSRYIRRNASDDYFVFSGGTGENQGGNIKVYGQAHSTKANDIEFRANTTVVASYDNSTGSWGWNSHDFTGVNSLSMNGKLNLAGSAPLTIASDAVTATKSYHTLAAEGGAATDDLTTIDDGGVPGTVLVLAATDTITLKDGVGNLRLAGDFTMTSLDDIIMLISDGATWREISRSNNG